MRISHYSIIVVVTIFYLKPMHIASIKTHGKYYSRNIGGYYLKAPKKISFTIRPNKMGGDPNERNQSLYCQYHQDWDHTTKDCKTLQAFLDQLVKAGKLKQFLQQSNNQADQPSCESHNGGIPRASLGTISVIFATMKEKPHQARGVMLMST